MSQESWLTITGILVSIALFGTSAIVGLVGWFLSRMISQLDASISEVQADNDRFRIQITRIETVLADRGYLPRKLKYPSPPPTVEDTA